MSAKTNRSIHLNGEISSESYDAFAKRLSRLEREGGGPVTFHLFSEGGSAHAALAYAGRMRSSPCQIRVHAYGLVASAAVLLLAAGDSRVMASEAWVMVHEDSGEISGSVKDLEKASKHMRRLEVQWAQLLAGLTTASYDTWVKLHADETFLTAKECLALGLIDKVV